VRTPFIEVRNLVKHFPGVVAVAGVDMAFFEGEIAGLVGKNGAGKSTLIKMLAGSITPDEGTISIGGQEVRLAGTHDANRLGMSFVHQELVDVPTLSVAENVLLGLGFRRRVPFVIDWKQTRARAADLLDWVGVDIDPAALVSTLSVAQRRMVTIAKALAHDAKLLVLDEPTASLTIQEVTHLNEIIRRLRDRGVGVVYVSHRLDEIFELTSRVIVMRDGQSIADRATASLDRRTLISLITGQEGASTALEARREYAVLARPQTPEVLEVSNLSRRGVVENVSFSVRRGEVLGLAGLVGSGRTEIARMIYGADQRTSGMIRVNGREVRCRSPRSALREGIALVPEERRAQGGILDFSITRNVSLPTLSRHRRIPGVPVPSRASEAKTARRFVDELRISAADESVPLRNLSGGNQQKVIVAKWMEHGASVLLFDEPTLGVDVSGKDEIYRLVRRLAAQDRAIVFISSEFSELVALCNRVLVIRDGQVVAELDGDEITEAAILEHCYAAPQTDGLSPAASA
jgi:ABC-type sugar transport system ATPase subunit